MSPHEIWMQYAYREAEKAYEKGEIPIGAVIVFDSMIIGKGHNQVETLKDPTAHAEIIAITSAAEYLTSKVLLGCTMYVTLEPCSMCAGAVVLSKIDALYFGAYDNKSGACGSVLNITNNKSLNHQLNVTGGIMDAKCGELIRSFFDVKR
ncbi:MAG TPA: tRNA adenosine(34) deaminase TadA [Ignavibacteria bacterium]|nr:tRNA adenosine(34) deaminase TadA [Ignavibacteria bacterium]HRF65300.1 tRNA adenosine(34) deaminase TadA [Ignavibacteria bacterium]HRJ05759.1 tRNA adenosine(34) deaminase TadA [Ignavibacteria bacterium]HRJ84952.1 tRNA adenosine(34) deaminase TadA [Ignavibacteria bacterium]